MKIAVAGGTGLVGRMVVEEVERAGHASVVLSRGAGVDLVAGTGIDHALAGVDAVIDVSNVTTLKKSESVGFFEAATAHLLDAGDRAGVRHHVALSIVGVDRVMSGYYEGKRRQEALVLAGPVPGTVLRATQFHEFAGQVLDQVPGGPVRVVPRARTQPVAARQVAEALVAAAVGDAQGLAPELAGPHEESLADMARRLLVSRGERARVLSPVLPFRGALAMARGGLLPTSDGPRGTLTFDAWLAQG